MGGRQVARALEWSPLRGLGSVSGFASRLDCPNDRRGYTKLRNSFSRGFAAASMSASASSNSKACAGESRYQRTVQDVFYRAWTVEAAEKLGLKGWVRNLEDGSVEAVFSGPSSSVDNMIHQCHSGPSAAKVSSVDVSKWDNGVPQGFEKRSW